MAQAHACSVSGWPLRGRGERDAKRRKARLLPGRLRGLFVNPLFLDSLWSLFEKFLNTHIKVVCKVKP